MNILLYKGNFAYNVVNYFVDELAEAFRNRKHSVYVLDLMEQDTKKITEDIRKIFSNNIELVLAFNGIDITADKSFYKKIGVVYGNLFVDHPFYHVSRLKASKYNNVFSGVYDEGWIKVVEKYIDKDLILTHIMHGGSVYKEQCKKEYDVIVVGGLNNKFLTVKEELDNMQDGIMKNIAYYLYENISDNYNISMDEYLEIALKKYPIPEEVLSMNEFAGTIAHIYGLIDSAKRDRNRYETVVALINNGVKVDYFGNCKFKDLNENSNFVDHGAVEYEKVLEALSKAKIVINDLPMFTNGSHERVFSGMLNKALVMSNYNNFSFNMYKDKENIVFYDIDNKEDIINKVKYYLKNDKERERIVNNAYEITAKYNTWDNRADEILQVYEVIKNNI